MSLKGPCKHQVSSPQRATLFLREKCVCIHASMYESHLYTLFSPFMPLRREREVPFQTLSGMNSATRHWIRAKIGVDLFRGTFSLSGRYISCFLSNFSLDASFPHLFDITFSSFYAVSNLFYFFASHVRFFFTPPRLLRKFLSVYFICTRNLQETGSEYGRFSPLQDRQFSMPPLYFVDMVFFTFLLLLNWSG